MSKLLLAWSVFLVAASASAQAVLELRSTRDLPLALVEVPGGDLQHIAAMVPSGAIAPVTLGAFPLDARPTRTGQVWRVSVPALLAPGVFEEFVRALVPVGAAAVVSLGPLPQRELDGVATLIESVPYRPVGRPRCAFADGGLRVRRGTPERVELAFALPPSDDPRSALLPAVEIWLQRRLAVPPPAPQVSSELESGCPVLVFRLAAGDEEPRLVLRRLRSQLAIVAASRPTPDEVQALALASRPRLARLATEGAAVVAEAAEALAQGVDIARMLAVPLPDDAAISELVKVVFAGHAGDATVVEQERRPLPVAPVTLDNGAMLTTTWRPGESVVVAVAVGGVAEPASSVMLDAAAAGIARAGYFGKVTAVLGIPTLAAVFPADAVSDGLEQLLVPLAQAAASGSAGGDTTLARGLGLAAQVSAESISVALALPPESDEGSEAARKFLSGFPSGGVRVLSEPPAPGLNWSPGPESPEVTALFALPPVPAALVAAEVVTVRAAGEAGARCRLVMTGGQLALAVTGGGGANTPALDGRLAVAWRSVVRKVSAEELDSGRRRTLDGLFGDEAAAVARAAAAVFLPVVPSPQDLMAVSARDVDQVLSFLGGWQQARRFGRGGQQPTAPPGAPAPRATAPVRQSPTPRPIG